MPDGADQLRELRANARERTAEEMPPEGEAPPPPEESLLPAGCPVVPLGVLGTVNYYLDAMGQLLPLAWKEHSHNNIKGAFGTRSDLLYQFWPRKTQNKTTMEWIVTGWKPELASEALMAAAARQGVWNPQEKVRGAGAWVGPEGELILHTGARLLIVRGAPSENSALPWIERKPGQVENFVYPSAPPSLMPAGAKEPSEAQGGVGREALALLESWNWGRPDLDPVLALGWVAAAMLGGAIPWRPLIWTTGGFGSGKSTLQEAIKGLLGPSGILQSSDPTAAGVRQVLKFDSRPVALDEAEADEDNRKMNALVKLARDAATGALAIRGGNDHEASLFTLRSCFLFSSILIPPLLPQDASRMAVLNLKPLAPGSKAPQVRPKRLAELGSRILRRLIDGWGRFPVVLDAWRTMLAGQGFSARGQDVYGTLLAAADLVLHDLLPDTDSLAGWAEKMKAVLPPDGDVADDAKSCVDHLLTAIAEAPRDRQRETIGWWAARAAGLKIAGQPADNPDGERTRCNRVLMNWGVKVVDKDGKLWLAVANRHTGLARLFEGTQWAGRPGADGVWRQSLERLAEREQGQVGVQIWFGVNARSTLLPIELLDGRESAANFEGEGGEDHP